MNLIGYVRVSTDEQARDGLSLVQQPERLAAYCALHDHTLLQVIADEGVSASVPLAKRAGGRQLLDLLKTDRVDGVVVLRLDRLFRDALDGLAFFRGPVARNNVAVHSISELVNSSTPAGKLSLTIQLAAAQYERDLAVQRATECSTSTREAGRVYGSVPYGCVDVMRDADGRWQRVPPTWRPTDKVDRWLQRDPETWLHRVGIVNWLTSGKSLRYVRQALLDAAIPSPTGKSVWSLNTLRALRTHHDSLAALPLADATHVATPAAAPRDPEVSSHV